MPNEAIELLNIKEDGIYIDGTLGRGGHSRLILEKLNKGRLICFDLDKDAIDESSEILKDYDNVKLIHDNYINMFKYIDEVDGILLDLGVSSPQFDELDRGFSYRYDSKLDMRMNKNDKLTAYDVVNNYDLEQLFKILKDYGEERFSRRIAEEIVKNRPINTTFELNEVIKKAIPKKALSKKGHPSKQTYQAIRIEVNHELDNLKQFLDEFDKHLKVNGRVVIISFHSLEDKLVKYKFKELSSVDDDKSIILRPEEVPIPRYKLLNHGKKASKEEIENNHRASSAIIRGVEKVWQE